MTSTRRIEERYCRRGAVSVVKSLTVFEFDENAGIRHLTV
jgi:hypothetical protein